MMNFNTGYGGMGGMGVMNGMNGMNNMGGFRRANLNAASPLPNYPRGSAEETAYLNKLEDDINSINVSCADYVRDNPMLVNNRTGETTTLAAFQKLRHAMMFNAMLQPLSNRVCVDSVIQTVGMYIGMSFVDKNFKNSVKGTILEQVGPHLENQIEKRSPYSPVRKLFTKVYDNLSEGKEMPLDPETAAVTQMGLLKRAYDDMRKPGADVDNVLEDYNKAVSVLHQKAAEDGVSVGDINTHFRFMAGKMIEKDPSTIKYFNETAYGGITQGDYKECIRQKVDEYGNIYDEKSYEWSGEFVNKDGNMFTGFFTPRKPRTHEDYSKLYKNRLGDIIKTATNDFPKSGAREEVINVLHASQADSYMRINRKLRSEQITERDAKAMRKSVANLEGIELTEADTTPEIEEAICKDIAASVKDYADSNKFANECDKHMFVMMMEDNLDHDTCMNLKQVATNSCMKEAMDTARRIAMDEALSSVRSEQYSEPQNKKEAKKQGEKQTKEQSKESTKESQSKTQRGSEFNNNKENNNPGSGYGYGG